MSRRSCRRGTTPAGFTYLKRNNALIKSSCFWASHAEKLDCHGARAPKKKQMSKALIESSYFRASYAERLDCRGARAPRNDGERSALNSPRHCERSAAIQEPRKQAHVSSTRVGRRPVPNSQ